MLFFYVQAFTPKKNKKNIIFNIFKPLLLIFTVLFNSYITSSDSCYFLFIINNHRQTNRHNPNCLNKCSKTGQTPPFIHYKIIYITGFAYSEYFE